jgi:hypothetical protein
VAVVVGVVVIVVVGVVEVAGIGCEGRSWLHAVLMDVYM